MFTLRTQKLENITFTESVATRDFCFNRSDHYELQWTTERGSFSLRTGPFRADLHKFRPLVTVHESQGEICVLFW